MNQSQENEIDLFEFFDSLWKEKWLIASFISIAVILGSVFIHIKGEQYNSKISYYVDTLPPSFSGENILADFDKMFYSKELFQKWKGNAENSTLDFIDFSKTKIVNGFVLTRSKDEQLSFLKTTKKDGTIIVKSNQLPVINDFFNYAKFISEELKVKYFLKIKSDLEIMKSQYPETENEYLTEQFFPLEMFISRAEKKATILAIIPPTVPIKVPPSASLILVISVVLGIFVGVFFVVIRNAIRNR